MKQGPRQPECKKPSSARMPMPPTASAQQDSRMTEFPGIPKVRRKRWAPKVKTGCITCRLRHVKCDEEKPHCRKCISTNRTCRGYALSRHSIYQPIQSPAPDGMALDSLSAQAFNMLRFDTVTRVTGGFDDEFWSVDVMRAARIYPVVWHASLALAAMHTRLGMTTSKPVLGSPSSLAEHHHLEQKYYMFALGQYNKAIQEVTKVMVRSRGVVPHSSATRGHVVHVDEQEMLLLVCIIFSGICTMQGDLQPALTHMKSALGLFYDWRYWERGTASDRPAGVLTPRSLTAVLTLFETHYESLSAISPQSTLRWAGGPPHCSTEPFKSSTDAYYEFLPLQAFAQSRILLRSTSKPVATQRLIEACQRERGIWNRKFLKFKREVQDERLPYDTVALLEVMAAALETFLGLASNDASSTPKWASSGPKFEYLIRKVESIFNILEGLELSTCHVKYPGYRFCPSINEILRFVAFFAFDLDVRRRAIALLRKCKRMDGLWHSALSADVAEAKLEFEKDSAALDLRDSCDCVHCIYVCTKHRPEIEGEEPPSEVTMLNRQSFPHNKGGRLALVACLPWVAGDVAEYAWEDTGSWATVHVDMETSTL